MNNIKIIRKFIKSNNIDGLINVLEQNKLEESLISDVYNFLKSKNRLPKFKKINFLIVSNCSFNVYSRLIEDLFIKKKINVKIYFHDFNNLLTIKKINELKKIDVALIYCNTEDLGSFSSYEEKLRYKKRDISTVINYIDNIIKKLRLCKVSKIFLSNFNKFSNSELGNYTRLYEKNKFLYIEKLNQEIDKIIKNNNIYLFDSNHLTAKFGLDKYHENDKFYFAKIPFSIDFAEYYFLRFINLLEISFGKIKKVLITDLDNTLWGGILGDDGPLGVEVGTDSSHGKAFLAYQKFLLNLKSRGVLLAICSKNSLDNVKEVFTKNQNMILKISDFVSIKANWLNKAKNIQDISQELNLNLDSMIFIDDSPVERQLVRNYLPSISVPEIPKDPSFVTKYIADNYFFDLVSLSDEDLKRSQSYISNRKRKILRENIDNVDDYLKSLKMKASINKFQKDNIQRIVQLFHRSNQFNTTTIRYSNADIEKFIKDDKLTFAISFKDRYSNYGITSLLVCNRIKNVLEIENWCMSCRVLNRTFEEFIMNYLINFSKKNKIDLIKANFVRTDKNLLVSELYKNLGFNLSKKNFSIKKYTCSINQIKNFKTFIEQEK
jgi:FkbH-like protein